MVTIASPAPRVIRSRRPSASFIKRRTTRHVILAGLVLFCALFMAGFLPETWDHALIYQLQRYTADDWAQFRIDYQERFRRKPPESLETWHRYAKYNKCSETEFYDSMDQDLETFRKQINSTKAMLDYTKVVESGLAQTDNYIAFQLGDHVLTVVASRNFHGNQEQQSQIERNIRWLLRPLVGHSPPISAIFFFDLHDHPTSKSTPDSMPIFTVCRMSYLTDGQPAPSSDQQLATLLAASADVFNSQTLLRHHHHHNYHPYHNSKDHVARLVDNAFHPEYSDSYNTRSLMVPYYFGLDGNDIGYGPGFGTRKDTIVWRGGTTGYDWGKSPRFRLVEQYGGTQPYQASQTTPIEVDFAFSNVVQNVSEHTLPPGTRIAARMEDYETQQHKYIMDVDGNAFTSRFPRLLKSGSLIFKSTRFREWYSERLKPFVDYIPVNYNLTDLMEKMEWVYKHPKAAEQIMEHGRHMSQKFLTKHEMRCYTYRLMLEYHTLFQGGEQQQQKSEPKRIGGV